MLARRGSRARGAWGTWAVLLASSPHACPGAPAAWTGAATATEARRAATLSPGERASRRWASAEATTGAPPLVPSRDRQPASSSHGKPRRGQAVLDEWERMLTGRGSAPVGEEQIRELVGTAVRLGSGRLNSSIPGQLIEKLAWHYEGAPYEERIRVLHVLARDFGPDASAVDRAALAWTEARGSPPGGGGTRERSRARGGPSTPEGGPEAGAAEPSPPAEPRSTAAEPRLAFALAEASRPLYLRVFAAAAQSKGGVTFLASLRADALRERGRGGGRREARREAPGTPARPPPALLDHLESSLCELLSGLFVPGLVGVEEVRWESTPASLLEKVMRGEAVLPMHGSWEALRSRLRSDRRVFVALHPCLPGEPLAAIYCALGDGLPARLDQVLGSGGVGEPASLAAPPADGRGTTPGTAALTGPHPTSATFYSISSMQPGLKGIDLGHQLIVRAAASLRTELPSLSVFGTLSPIPKLGAWAHSEVLAKGGEEEGVGVSGPRDSIPGVASRGELGRLREALLASTPATGLDAAADPPSRLLAAALDGDWSSRPDLARALRPIVLRLAARYLLLTKRRGRALDPVANFHLRNGAALHAVRFLADPSPARLRQSFGLMVNYKYDLALLGDRNRSYVIDGTIEADGRVWDLLDIDED